MGEMEIFMNIYFYAPQGFEPWDWRNTEIGIGGSETCVIEMSRRLSAMGHDVTVYAPVPEDSISNDGLIPWLPLRKADLGAVGLWIVFRSPESADLFKPHEGQKLWHISQDVIYFEKCGGEYTKERCTKFDKIFALCERHANYLSENFPFMGKNLAITSNGISTDRIEKLEKELDGKITRNPFKLIWTSSPDRGLEALLRIFKRAREFEPRLELDIFYGFDNLDKVIAKHPHCAAARLKKRIDDLVASVEGVTYKGRTGQTTLWTEYLKSGIWCYPTTFQETSCISCMEAQALGCIPITNPIWATKQNVQHGFRIHGDPLNNKLVQSRYVYQLIELSRNHELQDRIREEMIPFAKRRFDWAGIAHQWDTLIKEYK